MSSVLKIFIITLPIGLHTAKIYLSVYIRTYQRQCVLMFYTNRNNYVATQRDTTPSHDVAAANALEKWSCDGW